MRPLFLLLLPLAGLAQPNQRSAPAKAGVSQTSRHATLLDATGAVGPTMGAASVAGWRLWGLDAGGRVQAGLGLRATYFTAGQQTLDQQDNPDVDATMLVYRPRLLALNLALHARARVAGPLRLGFNLDVVGLSLGPTRDSQLFYRSGSPHGIFIAEPVPLNLLLGGGADRGSLNSEFYAALALPAGFGVRAGYAHAVTAWQLGNSPAYRYHRFRNLAVVGVSYEL